MLIKKIGLFEAFRLVELFEAFSLVTIRKTYSVYIHISVGVFFVHLFPVATNSIFHPFNLPLNQFPTHLNANYNSGFYTEKKIMRFLDYQKCSFSKLRLKLIFRFPFYIPNSYLE